VTTQLSSLQMTDDPRALFCQTGVAVRMGQRIGLATDGTHYGLLPFEAEMRRRLWWQIVILDSRASEVSGAGPALLTYTWNTKIPMNFNDSDLFPDMRTSPPERPGLTEMCYFRTRCEVVDFIRKNKYTKMGEHVPSRDRAIEEFEQHLEKEYLAYCDPSIPLHFMSIVMAKSLLAKIRIGLGHIQSIALHSTNKSQIEKDRLFNLG
jgi:hypothetical protein